MEYAAAEAYEKIAPKQLLLLREFDLDGNLISIDKQVY
jgi:hypothetical protein